MNEQGLQDSAVLLLSMGEDEAAAVFKYLSPKEVQKLGETMAKLGNVTVDRIDAVLTSFHSDAGQQSSIGTDSGEYIRSVLTKALGSDKAGYLLDRILQGGDAGGIEGLKWVESSTVAELIRNEHPQIIASILVHLERDQTAEILALFHERLRNDVMLRIATLDGIQPAALRELNDVLGKVLSKNDNLKKSALGGARTAAEILNFMNSTHETAIVESVREYDADLAQKIMDEMFVFENLLDLDDRGMRALLKETQSDSLVVALKGTSEALREKIFSNMSQRAAELLRDELETRGPVRVSEVEAQQKDILKIVRRLADEGEIVLGGHGDDAYV